ncbi:reverse transcriptase domain-containing protein [Thiorhodospira sibirica]|uniref:reverse transcriptase domain-containing protein n=1 Tax=Thiorhodospira sibirica TaxID=154347 RepID=UPI00022C5E10|nr:reverse transcriptase domain-containing protein [Thiorhodospira sibirica]
MVDFIRQVASAAVLNQAWSHVRKDKSRWTRDLSMQDVARDLPLHIGRISEDLLSGQYQPQKVRCFEISKGDGSQRLICAPAVRDKLIQRAVLIVLEPLGEEKFHPHSFGYRPMCTLDMALSCLREWVREGYIWLGDADILQCFDHIPHAPVLEQIFALCGDQQIVNLLTAWMENIPPQHQPFGAGYGLPQGMVLSPFLCNIYLHDMDMDLHEQGIPCIRYADDFIVLSQTESGAWQALQAAANSLQRLQLQLHPEKTQVIRTSPHHRFLGKRLPKAKRPQRIAG